MTRALFISPHLDDVAFSCGGLVARASALGEQPLIVTVFAAAPDSTAGLPGLDRAHAAWGMAGLSPRQVIERRREEDQAASAVLDAHSRFLEYADAIYRAGRYPSRESLFGEIHEADKVMARAIHDELVRLWAKLGEPRVYLPLGLGEHVDHRIVAGAAEPLCACGAEVWFYEDFPYARAVADKQKGKDASAFQAVDVTSTIEARLAAMARYRSQIPAIFGTEDFAEVTRSYAAQTGLPDGAYGERIWRASATTYAKQARVVVLADLGERFNGSRPPLLEPFGPWGTLLEATIARLRAADLPPVTVCCEDGVTGRLVSPPGRPAELAHALAEILSDPERQRSMGLAGRKRAEQHFDVRFYVSRLEQLCAGFLEGCRDDCSDAGPVS